MTHAKLRFTIPSGTTLRFTVHHVGFYGGLDGFQLVRIDPAIATFCFGDGTGTACPCGNAAQPGNGCPSSLNPAARTSARPARASLAADTLVLLAAADAERIGALLPGHRSAGERGAVRRRPALRRRQRRRGSRDERSRAARRVSRRRATAALASRAASRAGESRTYQVWYRNAAAFCTAATFNLTNGLTAIWQP